MNKKNIFIFLSSFLIYSCGFQPMFKDLEDANFNIKKINYFGKNEIGYLIKNHLNIEEKNDNKGLIVNLSFSEKISPLTKNVSGITTEENIEVMININITDNQKNNLLNDSISASKRLSVSSNIGSDDEARRVERNNLIINLAQKIKFKLQLIAKKYQ